MFAILSLVLALSSTEPATAWNHFPDIEAQRALETDPAEMQDLADDEQESTEDEFAAVTPYEIEHAENARRGIVDTTLIPGDYWYVRGQAYDTACFDLVTSGRSRNACKPARKTERTLIAPPAAALASISPIRREVSPVWETTCAISCPE
jgi:hypothetical protein